MKSCSSLVGLVSLCGFLPGLLGADLLLPEEPALELPVVGAYQARLLAPKVLEISLVTTKLAGPARVEHWNFATKDGQLSLPEVKRFAVRAGSEDIDVQAVGFKRRALYAPLKQRDLRVGNYLYLQLAHPVPENATIEIRNPDGTLWPAN